MNNWTVLRNRAYNLDNFVELSVIQKDTNWNVVGFLAEGSETDDARPRVVLRRGFPTRREARAAMYAMLGVTGPLVEED